MNYFEKNMECIKQYHVGLYEKLRDTVEYETINRLDSIKVDIARNGEKYLTIQKSLIQYRLSSSYSPKNEAEQWVKQYEFNNLNSIITQFGLGTGSFTREIIKNRGSSDVLLVYEPCQELFLHVIENYDITDILESKNVMITIEGINEFDFHNILQGAVNITNLTSQIRCTHPYYDTIFPESGIKYWKEIKDNFYRARININTEIIFGERFISNALYNSRFLKESNRLVELRKDLDLDVPAIVVAAGPSLQKNIEELKRAKGKAYIFVVDRILDYVLDEGLVPDFIVTIDPIKPIEYFTRRTDLTIPLLCELSSNQEVLERHKGRKIVYSCIPFFQKMYLSLGLKPPILSTGGSVATAAFSACIQLGFKKIVLVGQDLAYDGDVTHAGGVAEKVTRTRDIMVEGINGEQVRSRSDWYEFLTWFKDMITHIRDIQVIDTKDKGAKIQGTTLMPLKDMIDTYCNKTFNVEERLENKPYAFDDSDMVKIRKYFVENFDELYILKKKAKEAIEICEDQIRFYKRNHEDTPKTEKNYRNISKINQYISEQTIYQLLETYITAASAQQISELYKFTDDERTDKIATYQKSISIFQAIIDGINYVRPLYEEAMKHL